MGPDQLRQVFNDTDDEVPWLIIGGPEELEFLQGSKSELDLAVLSAEPDAVAEGTRWRDVASEGLRLKSRPWRALRQDHGLRHTRCDQ